MAEQIRGEGWTAKAAIPRSKGAGLTRKGMRHLIKRFESGAVQCLVTVDWLAEGVTIPALRAVALTSQPRGRVHLCQLCGRAMGTCAPDRWGTKTEALIFDPCLILRANRLEHPAAMGEPDPRPKSVKRASREGVAELVALPWAARVSALEVWTGALLLASQRLRPGPEWKEPAPLGPAARSMPATEYDRRLLRKWIGQVRHIRGEAHREAIRALAESDAEVTTGAVMDLVGVLSRVCSARGALRGAPYARLAKVMVDAEGVALVAGK